MGQYLYGGIVTGTYVPKNTLPKDKGLEDIKGWLNNCLNLSKYIISESESGYSWHIDPKVLDGAEVIEFIKAQGAMFGRNCERDLKEISDIPEGGEERLEYSEDRSRFNYMFHKVKTTFPRILHYDWRKNVQVYYELIAYFMCGKVISEDFLMCRYLDHLVRLQKDKYPIADCVRFEIE